MVFEGAIAAARTIEGHVGIALQESRASAGNGHIAGLECLGIDDSRACKRQTCIVGHSVELNVSCAIVVNIDVGGRQVVRADICAAIVQDGQPLSNRPVDGHLPRGVVDYFLNLWHTDDNIGRRVRVCLVVAGHDSQFSGAMDEFEGVASFVSVNTGIMLVGFVLLNPDVGGGVDYNLLER